jgi:hypothetical protein
MISCAQAGGAWNGFYCDMTQVNRRQAAQSQCASRGGTWDDASGTCDMTSANSAKVDAAITAANAQAAMGTAAGFNAALGILAGAANAAVASGRQSDIATAQAQIQSQKAQAACAARGGTWDDMTGTCTAAPPAPVVPVAAPAPDLGTTCIQRGGNWDGTACTMPAPPPPSWITQLLPQFLQAPPAPTYAPSPVPGAPPVAVPAPGGMSSQQQTILALLEAFGGEQGAAFANALQGSIGVPSQGVPGAAPGTVPDGTPCQMPDRTLGNSLGGICAEVGAQGYGSPSRTRETF